MIPGIFRRPIAPIIYAAQAKASGTCLLPRGIWIRSALAKAIPQPRPRPESGNHWWRPTFPWQVPGIPAFVEMTGTLMPKWYRPSCPIPKLVLRPYG